MPTDHHAALSPDELQRYHRQLILPQLGAAGQQRLRRARVLLVGAGGLGSPVALYLAAAGVGELGIVDGDVVETSNLHRQIVHGTSSVGRAKVASAADRLRDVNPHVAVTPHHARLTRDNALELFAGHDLVVDGTDNFATRYLVNDACVLLGIPNVFASVLRFAGQLSVLAHAEGPCYRCLWPEPPPAGSVPSCAEAGVLGVLPGLLGTMQATEAIKVLAGIGEPLIGRLVLVDALRMDVRTIEVARDPACPACGTRAMTTLAADYDAWCGTSPFQQPMTDPTHDDEPVADDEITPRALAALLAGSAPPTVIDVREPHEWAIARIEAARLVPLASLPSAAASLDRDRDYVVYCHHGMRSEAAMRWLQGQGFTRVRNLVGGIDRWTDDVDPTLRRY